MKYSLILFSLSLQIFILTACENTNNQNKTMKNDTIMKNNTIIPNSEIKLLEVDYQKDIPLLIALDKRQSKRQFNNKEINLQELSNLLWSACGINRDDDKFTVPLLWNMYLYVAMKHGIYLYDTKEQKLTRISEENIIPHIAYQDFVKKAQTVFIYVLDLDEMTEDWVESTGGKMFYAGNQVGHVSQNVYLCAAALELNTVAMSWFDNNLVAKKLNLTGNKKAFLIQPIGKNH